MIGARTDAGRRPRAGITLTEILIAIMILGVGLVSLATLFPIGLLRLRDATRWSRSATLLQTAASDATARGLLNAQSFQYADQFNYIFGMTPWFYSANAQAQYNPLTQDTAYYGDDPNDQNNPGANALNTLIGGGPGLAFAYDPLWRYQTISTINNTPGYYPGDTYEARFGYGLMNIGPDPSGGTPSAHGLQRLTNFNRAYTTVNGNQVPVMPASIYVPSIFVSQEDVVWQDPKVNTYTIDGSNVAGATTVVGPSPVIPDLNTAGGQPSLDWRFTWMFTGQLTSANNGSCFDGNIVIFENRPFGIGPPAHAPFSPAAPFSSQMYAVDGETVVEGVFGYSGNVVGGYGAAAARTVLLRWSTAMPDPVVRPGDWIADVTYERQQLIVYNPNSGSGRFMTGSPPSGYPDPTNNGEWDNLPAQRCYWYQVQKVSTPAPDLPSPPGLGSSYRSMVVYVNQNLQSRTLLNASGQPVYYNAALIAPNVVNVIPQTIFIR